MTHKCEIIAEAGVNHNGDPALAHRLIDIAADAGADTIKFQTFRTDALTTAAAPQAAYQSRNLGQTSSQRAMLEALELPLSVFHELQAHCRERSIGFLSTPFDEDSLRFLIEDLGVKRVKIGSGDLTNAPLLLALARRQAPVILSTGMADLGEVEDALSVLAFGYAGTSDPMTREARQQASQNSRSLLAKKVTLLHCTSDYPAAPAHINLEAMDTLAQAFGLPVGYSDHSEGLPIAMAAVARGAGVLEKHFTSDRDLPGPDHIASLEPEGLADLVAGVRAVERALGDGVKRPRPPEMETAKVARKSLVAARPIAAGEVFSTDNLTIKRPGTGRSPLDLYDLLGRPARRSYAADDLIDD